MRAAGEAAIASARADGRWEAAYAGPATIEVPDDLTAALAREPAARAAFEQLTSQNRYAILYRVTSAKRADTRARRVQQFVAMLARRRDRVPAAATRPRLRRRCARSEPCRHAASEERSRARGGRRLPRGARALRRCRSRGARARCGGRRGRVPPGGRDHLLAGRRADPAPARGPQRGGRGRARRSRARPHGERRAVRARVDALGAAARLRRTCCRGHALLPDPRGDRARGARAPGGDELRRALPALVADPARGRAAGASSRRGEPARGLADSRRARAVRARHADPGCRRADDRSRAVRRRGGPRRRLARDRHRPRPAQPRGRGRPARGRARLGGDDGARLQLRARAPRGGRAARDARPRGAPLPGRLRCGPPARRRRRLRPARGRHAILVPPAPVDRPRGEPR